jgi:hypothetical protein
MASVAAAVTIVGWPDGKLLNCQCTAEELNTIEKTIDHSGAEENNVKPHKAKDSNDKMRRIISFTNRQFTPFSHQLLSSTSNTHRLL